MIPILNGVSRFWILIPKGLSYLFEWFAFIHLHFVDPLFKDKVIEWFIADFFKGISMQNVSEMVV